MKSNFLYIEENLVEKSYRYCNFQRIELKIPLQKGIELEASILHSKKYWLDFIWNCIIWTLKTWINYFSYTVIFAMVFIPLYTTNDYDWVKEIDGLVKICSKIAWGFLMIRTVIDAILSRGIFSRRVFFLHLERAIMKEYPDVFTQKISCK